MKERFSTYDVNLAAYLVFHGIPPTLEKVKDKDRVIFYFPARPDLYKTLDWYNHNALVPVTDFVNCLKAVRGWMIRKRTEGRNG
jgi:hypothetical protein